MASTLLLDRKACIACARAKRKCNKEIPCCSRCEEKGIDCNYPARKPCSFVILQPGESDPDVAEAAPSLCDTATFINSEASRQPDHALRTRGIDALIPSTPLYDLALDPREIWFLSPPTWELEHILNLDISQISSSLLKKYPKGIYHWLTRWAEKGSNPFIHHQLYRQRFPRCVQDAYTALSCFIAKTPANEDTAYQILQARAEQLLHDHMTSPFPEFADKAIDTFDHLARVHSLLVYQILGLFDNDIRLRHLAEERIPLLFKWADDMLESASKIDCLSGFLNQMTASPEHALLSGISNVPFKPMPRALADDALWRAWVFAECIRRTWSIATGIQTTYLTLQRGWAACPGGTMLTTRKGVWEADSAFEWARLCSEMDVGFMHRRQTERLFDDLRVDDVDEFGRVMMEVTFGQERMQRWQVDMGEQP